MSPPPTTTPAVINRPEIAKSPGSDGQSSLITADLAASLTGAVVIGSGAGLLAMDVFATETPAEAWAAQFGGTLGQDEALLANDLAVDEFLSTLEVVGEDALDVALDMLLVL